MCQTTRAVGYSAQGKLYEKQNRLDKTMTKEQKPWPRDGDKFYHLYMEGSMVGEKEWGVNTVFNEMSRDEADFNGKE